MQAAGRLARGIQPLDDFAVRVIHACLTVDFQTGEIGIGSRYRTFQRKCGIDPYAPLKIRLFVDGTIAECFVNDAYCFTMRIYDSLGTGVSFRSTAPGLTVKDLVVRVCE